MAGSRRWVGRQFLDNVYGGFWKNLHLFFVMVHVLLAHEICDESGGLPEGGPEHTFYLGLRCSHWRIWTLLLRASWVASGSTRGASAETEDAMPRTHSMVSCLGSDISMIGQFGVGFYSAGGMETTENELVNNLGTIAQLPWRHECWWTFP